MPTSLHREDKSRGRRMAGLRSQDGMWAVALVALPAIVVGLTLYLPQALVLPAAAVLALTAGFALEAARRLSPALRDAAHLKEYAAGLVFAGFAASILTNADAALIALSEVLGEIPAKDGSDR